MTQRAIDRGLIIGISSLIIGIVFLWKDLHPNYNINDPAEWRFNYIPFLFPILLIFIGILFIFIKNKK